LRNLDGLIAEHPLFAGFLAEHLALIAGCGRNMRFHGGEFLCRAGLPAEQFFLVRSGKVALEIEVPGRGPFRLSTAGAGDVVGWSWLIPPYQWQFDARVLEDGSAIQFDGACLRGKCDADPVLGYALMKAFAGLLVRRHMETRLQLIDVYGRRD
jgi:CRP/FNR family transcriptional regulator, cyclic AMP receptor protein